jgi:hypothetical protein
MDKPGAAALVGAVTGQVEASAPYGFWEGVDGRHGNASPRDKMTDPKTGKPVGELVVRIARRMDPEVHGTRLAKDRPAIYAALLRAPNDSIAVEDFYAILDKKVPPEVMRDIEKGIEQLTTLYGLGLGPPPPVDKALWRRSAVR